MTTKHTKDTNTTRVGRTFGRIALGAVLHDPEPEFVTWWTSLLTQGLDDGDVVLNNHSVPVEAPIPVVHNHLVRLFLKTDCDTLCIVEDDHDGPADVIRRMRSKPANQGFDVVCASYVNRRGRPWPNGWMYNHSGAQGYEVHVDLRKVAKSGTQACDGSALGCVLIRRWLLVAMQGELSLQDAQWFRWIAESSQDVDFYVRAMGLGARSAVDRDVWLTHLGKYRWEKSDFEEILRANRWRWRWQTLRQLLSRRSTTR